MSMTKKDYELIATSLNKSLNMARELLAGADNKSDRDMCGGMVGAVSATILNMEYALQAENPRFRADIFRAWAMAKDE